MNLFSNENPENQSLSIMIFGDNLEGKASVVKGLLQQQDNNSLVNQLPICYFQKQLSLNKKRVNLHLWDINTNQNTQDNLSLIKELMQKQNGFILVFDINNSDSLRNLTKWYKIILETTLLHENNPKIYLFSTNCNPHHDNCKSLNKQDIEEWIDDNEIALYIETHQEFSSIINYPYYKKIVNKIMVSVSIYHQI